MVDISHVSDKTFDDVLASSAAPLIATHSSCRALCDAPRNLTDQMMRDLAAKGGVVQINFHIGFFSDEFRDAKKANPQFEAGDRFPCHGASAAKITPARCIEIGKLVREFVDEGKLPRVEWTEILDHIDHAVKLVGADHVGLGSDFDGADMPYGMDDASYLPQITSGLLKRGYSGKRRAENSWWQYAPPHARCGGRSAQIGGNLHETFHPAFCFYAEPAAPRRIRGASPNPPRRQNRGQPHI